MNNDTLAEENFRLLLEFEIKELALKNTILHRSLTLKYLDLWHIEPNDERFHALMEEEYIAYLLVVNTINNLKTFLA